MSGAIWIGLGIVLAITALVWGFVYQRKLAQAMEAWAHKGGWDYTKKDRHLPSQYDGFDPFGVGSSRTCRHVMQKKHNGRSTRIMGYQYTVQNGKDSTTHQFLVAHARMARRAPDLTIKPEHFGHKIFDALGGEDIDFESAQFSKRFWVKCKDRRFAYDAITPAMMEHLLANPGGSWQWRGQDLVFVQNGAIHPKKLDGLLARLDGFLSHLPRRLDES